MASHSAAIPSGVRAVRRWMRSGSTKTSLPDFTAESVGCSRHCAMNSAGRAAELVAGSPVGEYEIEAHCVVGADGRYSKVRRLAGIGSARGEAFDQDVVIWQRKIYRPAPLLCDGDGPLFQLRHWYRQFFSETDAAQSIAK